MSWSKSPKYSVNWTPIEMVFIELTEREETDGIGFRTILVALDTIAQISAEADDDGMNGYIPYVCVQDRDGDYTEYKESYQEVVNKIAAL